MKYRKYRPLYLSALLSVLLGIGCNNNQPSETTAETSANDEVSATTPADPPTPSEAATTASDDGTLRVLVLGNSLAAGYGLDPDQAFPALLQDKIDDLGWNVEVVNAGVSGETSAGGLSRIDWLLREPVDVLILELGGNDGLRGIDPEVTQQNLQGIIDRTRTRYPEARIVLAGMQIPTNLGSDYTARFREVFPALAEENDTALIPFLLDGVGGVPALNQPDGIHPTAEGHRIVANTVWNVLRPVLASMLEEA